MRSDVLSTELMSASCANSSVSDVGCGAGLFGVARGQMTVWRLPGTFQV